MSVLREDLVRLAVIVLTFLLFGFWFASYLVSWDAEWGYVFLGDLAMRGEIRLFQDDMLGERLPLPFYVMGLSQRIAGRSLWAARLTSLALGGATIACVYALGRSLGGSTAGAIAALLMVTNAMVVGYYAAASYFAFCALLIAAGLLAAVAVGAPWGPLLAMACFTAIALSRAHLAVMTPVVLVYLLVRARRTVDRVMLVLVAVVPLLVFFLWSPEHLKIFAYVPLLNRWVAPLGYRSVFALGGAELAPDPHWADHISIFVKRYAFWFLATVVIAWGWLVSRKDVPVRACPRAPLVFLGGLAIYALLWQVAILWRYPASVPAWATTFAPLWAVVLGVGASALLGSGTRPRVKTAVVVVLVVVFAVSPARARHPSMPLVPPPATTPTALAHDASLINAVMPPGARVFLVGGSMAPYLAGVSPYPQQIIHPWTLVPSTDERAISRSGLWGPRQIERWLSRDAPYAIIYPEVLHGWYGSVESYQPLVRQIEVLLDQHYVLVASHGDRVNGTAYLIYRRKAMTPQ